MQLPQTPRLTCRPSGPRCYGIIWWWWCISLVSEHDAELAWFFSDFFPVLGNFHLKKVLLWRAVKYLIGIGVINALIERKVCGKKVVASVLSRSHYVTSLQGMFIVSEVFIHLLGKCFGRLNNVKSLRDSI